MTPLCYRTLLIVALIFGVMMHGSSQSSNPFEIRSRLDSVAKLPVQTPADSITLRNISTISVSENAVEIPDSVSVTSANPFDVDHLPLRKSQITKTTREFDADPEVSAPENVSITFIFWILLLSAALLAIVLNISFSTIRLVFRSLINLNLFKLFHREEGNGISLAQLFMYIVFFLNISVFAFLFIRKENPSFGFAGWSSILTFITVFYLAKHFLILAMGFIFNIQKTSSLYNFSILAYHIFGGIILLPINLTAAFSPGILSDIFMYTALCFLVLLIILKIARGLLISLEYWGDRFFQFFLYLCTFEILPVLILVKFLLYQVNL